MKRQIAAGLSILVVAAGVGWNLARHTETSAGLDDIRLIERSERSNPGPTEQLAGIRIRLSPSDFDERLGEKDGEVPQIALAEE